MTDAEVLKMHCNIPFTVDNVPFTVDNVPFTVDNVPFIVAANHTYAAIIEKRCCCEHYIYSSSLSSLLHLLKLSMYKLKVYNTR